VEVYVNGVEVFRAGDFVSGYEAISLSPAAQGAFKPGKNVLAIHCHQTRGGQYVDLGLVQVVPAR
jgi:hypothetical protein